MKALMNKILKLGLCVLPLLAMSLHADDFGMGGDDGDDIVGFMCKPEATRSRTIETTFFLSFGVAGNTVSVEATMKCTKSVTTKVEDIVLYPNSPNVEASGERQCSGNINCELSISDTTSRGCHFDFIAEAGGTKEEVDIEHDDFTFEIAPIYRDGYCVLPADDEMRNDLFGNPAGPSNGGACPEFTCFELMDHAKAKCEEDLGPMMSDLINDAIQHYRAHYSDIEIQVAPTVIENFWNTYDQIFGIDVPRPTRPICGDA